jgi:ornithine decarboxylase
MTRKFKIERAHAQIVSKSTIFKVLRYLDRKRVETPLLLIDKDKIKEKASLVGSGISNSRVFYAMKANPDREILKLVDSMGVGFEIASEGELKLLKVLKVAPERIISSNPVKSHKFLRAAKRYGLKYFAYDSMEEVEKMARFVPGANVYIRIAVANEGSEWPLSRKFGVELDMAIKLMKHAKERGLNPAGITFHVGSQCLNMYNWDSALYKAKALWEMAEREGIGMKFLNIGGGYPINYTKGVVGIELIERNIDRIIRDNFPPGTDVMIEPGRSIVGDAGVFVSRVIGKALRGHENWIQIDVGVFNGLVESIGGINYTYIAEDGGGRKKEFTVAGPSCDGLDVMGSEVRIQEPDVGSLMLIPSAGAYTTCYASEFNGFSIPKVKII